MLMLDFMEGRSRKKNSRVIAKNTCPISYPLALGRVVFVHNFCIVCPFHVKFGIKVHTVVSNIE